MWRNDASADWEILVLIIIIIIICENAIKENQVSKYFQILLAYPFFHDFFSIL